MRDTTRARRATALAATAAVVVGAVAVTTVQPAAALPAAAGAQQAGMLGDGPAVVSSLTPSAGPVEGGTAVVVLGSNFKSLDPEFAGAVTFGGVPATRIAIISDAKLVAVTPPGPVGTVAVKVVNAAGASASTSARFGYRMTLVPRFDSAAVKATGGDQITVDVTGGSLGVTASAFAALHITAKVGGVAAAVKYVSDTQLKVVVPPSATTGISKIQLLHEGYAGPESEATLAYHPVVTSVTPAKVSTAGGVSVKILGAGFLGVDAADPGAVTIGGVAATFFDVISATQLTADLPAGVNGYAPVEVSTPSGTSTASPAARIAYRAPLGIDTDALTVKAGGGPHLLTVTGGTLGADLKEFAAEAIVARLGTTTVRATWVDPIHLAVTLPPTTAASVKLSLTHDSIPGPVATVDVVPVVTSLSTATDTVAGGRTVKIKIAGPGADGATDFTFGSTPADCDPTGSGTSLVFVCTVPPAAEAGPVWVGFTSGTQVRSRFTAAATFSYTDLD